MRKKLNLKENNNNKLFSDYFLHIKPSDGLIDLDDIINIYIDEEPQGHGQVIEMSTKKLSRITDQEALVSFGMTRSKLYMLIFKHYQQDIEMDIIVVKWIDRDPFLYNHVAELYNQITYLENLKANEKLLTNRAS